MWQVVIGIYVIVLVMSCILLWAALAQSKKADQNIESHSRSTTGKTTGVADRTPVDMPIQVTAFSQHSKK